MRITTLNMARETGGTAGLRPIERKIRAVFAAGVIALAALGIVAYLGIHQLLVQAAWADHSRQVIESVHALRLSEADADTVEHDFVLTGDPQLLEPFRRAVLGARESLRELRTLTADNAAQQRRLDALEPIVNSRLSEVSQLVDLRRVQGAVVTRPAIEAEAPRLIGHPVRVALREFEAAEQALLNQRETLARDRGRLAVALIAAGGVLSAALLAAAVVAIGRAFGRAREVESQLREDHARLQESMGQRTEQLARINESLLENEQRMAGVIGSAMDAVIAIDDRQCITLFNGAAEAMFGYRSIEIVGEPLERLIPQRFRAAHTEHVDGFGRTQVTRRRMGQLGRIYGLRRDGTEFPIEAAISQAVAAGHKLYTVILRDITERIRSEDQILRLNADLEGRVAERTTELQAANRELEAFGYTVAHDLRAPLRAMEGFSQALIEDYGEKVDGEARLYLDQIIRGSQHLGELIDGLLQLSRSVRGELRRDRVDLSALAEQIMAELARGDPSRNVSWQIERGLTARADARMMEIVMRNLLGNAWKYTAHTPAPMIRVFSGHQGGQREIHVVDNGIGFNMAHSEKLFQPFQRLHRQDEFPGIGIGLATVQRIVHRHGGQIRAASAPGRGAEFTFSLPQAGDDTRRRRTHEAQDNAAGGGQPAGRAADLAGAAQGESGQPGRGGS